MMHKSLNNLAPGYMSDLFESHGKNLRSGRIDLLSIPFSKKVQVGNDQEKAHSDRNSHSKNRGGKN